jgi:hypothetical protein
VITEARLKELLEEAATKGSKAGIEAAFTSLGIDTTTAAARIEAQRDMTFLRNMRVRASTIAFGLLAGMAATAGAITEGVHWLTTGHKPGGL